MTVSVLASGQIGSDSTSSPISGSHNPGGGVTPDFVIVFVIENGNTGASEVTDVTYGGVTMSGPIFGGFDGSGEGGQVTAWYMDSLAAIGTGSQTVSVSFSGSSGANRRVYCVSFDTDGDGLSLWTSNSDSDDQANPSDSQNPDVGQFVSGAACLYYGGPASAVSVANGAQLAESDFSGGSQCGSLIWANTTVENGTITMGWTAASDDVAAIYMYVIEITMLRGNVTLSASPVENANVVCVGSDSGEQNTVTDASGNYVFQITDGEDVFVYCYYDDGGGNKYTADLHWGMSTT